VTPAVLGVIDEVLTSSGFHEAVGVLSARLGRSREGVMADSRAYLEEMASKQGRVAVDVWARWARYLYSRAFRLDVDAAEVRRIRELAASHPLVFLPSHRSNLDPYVMCSLLHQSGMPVNHTLGGINMAFWPLGPLGRRVGVVFIRRSFRDNDVYRFVLQRYLSFLVSKGVNLEWYIEGTRSRTGKLAPPRLGLLNYLVDAVDALDRVDVLAVPTSITYDVLPEARDMTAESRGSAKKAEGLRWLVRYARAQRGDMGAVHIRFGEPLSLAVAAGEDRRLAVSKLAFEVCVRINRATLLTGSALLLFALLGVEGRALTLAEVQEVTEPVIAYAELRAIPLDTSARALTSCTGLQDALHFLVDNGLVMEFAEGPEPVYRIEPDQELVAAFYRNSILHWFVDRAIVELVLLHLTTHAREGSIVRQGNEEAWRIRDLLKFEFFFPERAEFDQALAAEMSIVDEHWRVRGSEQLSAAHGLLTRSGLLVAHRTLRSFIEAYLVVAEHLVELGDVAAVPADVVTCCLSLGRQRVLQRRVASDEAVSAHLFGTAMKLAQHRELLGGEMLSDREAFAAELRDLLHRIEVVHDLDREQACRDEVRVP
jgi:glycerol-3-phosphate O-acyltransferase